MDGSVTLPPGYDDEAAFLTEARERFAEAQGADSENREAALDDLKFLAGEQWDASVKQSRELMGRPCLTVNRLPQFVAQVIGDIRINKPAIKVRPAEDGDEDIARVRQGLIRSIEHDANAPAVYANAAQSQIGCGIGNFRVSLEYAADDVFEQNIVPKPIPNPFAVVWDPLSVEATGKDARYCFVVDEVDRKTFEAKYPDATPSELSTAAEGGWVMRDVVRVTEYWLIKETPVTIGLFPDGQIREVGEGDQPIRTRKTVRRSACMYLINGHSILEPPYELPISRVPIFRVKGWEIHVSDKRVRFGLVRFAKDPQRLMNYWRSVSAELLALAPRAQWISDEKAVEGREDDFREAHRSGDPLLIYNKGNNPPERVQPPPFPDAVLREAALNAQDMKDVTGLHDASLGVQSNETSGRAILARDRQGDVATFIYPDNLKDAIEEAGRVMNQLIGLVYDTARTVRVLGDDESVTLQRINDPMNPESLNIGSGRYDVVVETGPSYSTKRVEAAESMTEFLRSFPQAAPFIGDLYVKAQDWPLNDEIADRLKKMLPPQLQDEEDRQEPDPAQQQAAQMQQMMAEMELRLKQAEVAKAEAEAAKAEAEAIKAANEINAPPPEPKPQPDPRKVAAEASQAEAKAVREWIGAESDAMDLQVKPADQDADLRNKEADLKAKLNPPEKEPA